jgi:copper chaperone NosL
MSYQPPMFGTRQMLNFQTTAWPGPGGFLAMAGVGLGVLCVAYEVRLRRRRRVRTASPNHAAAPVAAGLLLSTLVALLAFAATGCAKKPQAIAYGTDACEHCSMIITDERHGAVLVTAKGRSHKFDAVECMLQSVMPGGKLADTPVHSWHVTDYAARAVLVDAKTAAYLVSPNLPSPMGAGLSAFATREAAERVQQEKGGTVMDWEGMKDYIREWSQS